LRIKRYHLALATDAEGLQAEVSRLISEGWQPFGQLIVAQPDSNSKARFFQVMVQVEGDIRV
jgi:Domain of unknown function (DUF1737)